MEGSEIYDGVTTSKRYISKYMFGRRWDLLTSHGYEGCDGRTASKQSWQIILSCALTLVQCQDRKLYDSIVTSKRCNPRRKLCINM